MKFRTSLLSTALVRRAVLAGLSLSLAFSPINASAQSKKPATATKKIHKKNSNKISTAKKAAIAATPLVLMAADEAQLQAAQNVHYGDYICEFGQHLTVSPHTESTGYVQLDALGKRYVMKPILSSTGATRMEDVRGDMLLLQIAFKSMFMNVKTGNRLLDGCENAAQVKLRQDYENQPQQDHNTAPLLQQPKY